jgi:hypothetical protein
VGTEKNVFICPGEIPGQMKSYFVFQNSNNGYF